jgi:hypothetical protein
LTHAARRCTQSLEQRRFGAEAMFIAVAAV